MASELPDVVVRVAATGDIGAIASLRSLRNAGAGEDPDFEPRMAAWLAAIATRSGSPRSVTRGSAWRPYSSTDGCLAQDTRTRLQHVRSRGLPQPRHRLGALATIITTADERCYARLVLSPSARSLPFYRRAGFVVPDDTAGDDRLLVRPGRPR
jgi:hypothetical protein